MKKMKLFIALSFLIASQLHGQNNAIEKTNLIDKICTDYDSLIELSVEEEMDFYPAHITIKSTLNKRAIGPVEHTITLYFDEHEEVEQPIDDEGTEFITLKYATLRKVIVIFESGSYLYNNTYYFDENAYLIKFVSTELGYECAERINYFDEHNPIRFMQTPIKSEDCLEEEQLAKIDLTKLSPEQMDMANYWLEMAEKYRAILTNQYDLIKD